MAFIGSMLLFMFICLSRAKCFATVLGEQKLYAVVVDAGSTGSRAFVFHKHFDASGASTVTSTKCLKVKPGLSSFFSDLDSIGEYLIPLFVDAARIIPTQYLNETSIHVIGTAGMRILPEDAQHDIWVAVKNELRGDSRFVFNHHLIEARTIDGHHEAFCGVLSSNFVIGSIDAALVPTGRAALVGSLDMGGSSTQLTAYEGPQINPNNDATQNVALTTDAFWSHSWIRKGMQIVRNELWAVDEVLYHSLFTTLFLYNLCCC